MKERKMKKRKLKFNRNKKKLPKKKLIKIKTSPKPQIKNRCIKIILIILITLIYLFQYYLLNFTEWRSYGLSFHQKMKDYLTKNFTILRRRDCWYCGLFSFYAVHLGAVNKSLTEGLIPIIDMQSFRNKYNLGNLSFYNPWESFFYQMNNYTLDEVKKYAKNFKYGSCSSFTKPDERFLYYDNDSIKFWRNFASKYMPIKKEILIEAKIIMKKLFGKSKNVLGVKLRGTDYLKKPKHHAVQPRVEKVISDVREMDKKYNYDFIFFSTEDENMKNKFIKNFVKKIKLLDPIIPKAVVRSIKDLNEQSIKYLDYVKNYLLNMIIISKCLDLVASRCGGTLGIYIFSKGFRHTKIYNLGLY